MLSEICNFKKINSINYFTDGSNGVYSSDRIFEKLHILLWVIEYILIYDFGKQWFYGTPDKIYFAADVRLCIANAVQRKSLISNIS